MVLRGIRAENLKDCSPNVLLGIISPLIGVSHSVSLQGPNLINPPSELGNAPFNLFDRELLDLNRRRLLLTAACRHLAASHVHCLGDFWMVKTFSAGAML
jgi:hypothetical protein